MGVDLYGKNGEILSINWNGWRALIDAAVQYGWRPVGTSLKETLYDPSPEEIKNWNGSYFSNDFQLITDEDAAQLSACLALAVNDPDSRLYIEDPRENDAQIYHEYFTESTHAEIKDFYSKFVDFFSRGGALIG